MTTKLLTSITDNQGMSRFFAKSVVRLASSVRKNEQSSNCNLNGSKSSAEARAFVPYALAARLGVLPIKFTNEASNSDPILECLVERPLSAVELQELRFATGYQISCSVGGKSVPQQILVSYLGDDQLLAQNLDRAVASVPRSKPENHLSLPPSIALSEGALFLEKLLEYVVVRNASDLTITPRREGAVIKMRVNGELYSQGRTPLPLALHQQIVSRIKVLSGLDTTQRVIPQDGRLAVAVGDRSVSLRVGMLPTLHGESVAIRIITGGKIKKLDELGISSATISHLIPALQKRAGIIIFAGPTGSGKTTTMYAALLELLERNLRVVTVEDPIEIELPEVIQCAVNQKLGVGYPELLRSVLRHDPDVLLLGEVRDRESAQIAYQAAHTGHLILTSTHAVSAADVFSRLSQLEVPALQLSDATLLIVSQRLIPKLCTNCRTIDLSASNNLGAMVYKNVSCEECDYSGFRGRVLVTDCLPVTREIRHELEKNGRLASTAQSQIESCGISEALKEAVLRGEISYQQMQEYSFN